MRLNVKATSLRGDASSEPQMMITARAAGASAMRAPTSVDSTRRPDGVETSATDARAGIRLGFLIHDVSRMRRSAYDQFMKPLGITRSQWWVLAFLSRHDGMMQTQLAELMEVGKASVGDNLEGLEKREWVVRRADPVDKRARRVFLTKSAQTLIRHMTIMEHEFNLQILAELSEPETKELVRSLSKIKNAIARLAPHGGRPDAEK